MKLRGEYKEVNTQQTREARAGLKKYLGGLPSQVLDSRAQPLALDGRDTLVIVVSHEVAIDALLGERTLLQHLRYQHRGQKTSGQGQWGRKPSD